jgi:uncharacterized protein
LPLSTARRVDLILGLCVAAWLAGVPAASETPMTEHQREVETWRTDRIARLRRPDGWLSLVGLFWLEAGENRVGSDPSSAVRLPAGAAPPRLGTIVLSGSLMRFRAEPGVVVTSHNRPVQEVVLQTDQAGEPTLLQHGSVSFYVIQRGERLGVRVKDANAEALKHFRGIENFPFVESWRLIARFEPSDSVRHISVPNILGNVTSEESPGALAFEHGGKTYRLDVVREAGTEDFFVIFGDSTNGHETYGGGRFLYASPPKDGRTVLDFNKAYNPPCVFTPYATCPLPPPQNRLQIRIEAGEKNYEHD